MQTANILLALGGDVGNQVPLYGVTVAEVAVLRAIHGDDAISEIDVTGDVARTHRQEIGRLTEKYGRQQDDRRIAPEVAELFPGAAARVFETFDELELPDDAFIATGRKTVTRPERTRPASPALSRTGALEAMTVKALQALADREGVDLEGVNRKADIVEAIETHRISVARTQGAEASDGADEPDDEDGIGEINDEHAEGAEGDDNKLFG